MNLPQTGRMAGEVSTDLQAIGAPVRGDFEKFAQETGRELKLEIEPGTFLVANAGSLVCTVQVRYYDMQAFFMITQAFFMIMQAFFL